MAGGAVAVQHDASLHLDGEKQICGQHRRSIVWDSSNTLGNAIISFDTCPPGKFQPIDHEKGDADFDSFSSSRGFSMFDFVGCPGQCPPGATTPGHNFAENRFVDANAACTVTCPSNQACIECPKGRSNDGSTAGLTSEDQCLSPPESVYIVRVMGPSTIEVIVKLPTGVDNEIANVTHFYFATLSGNFTSEVTESGRYAIQVPEAKCDLDGVTVHSCNEYGCSVHSTATKYDPSTCVLECIGGTYAGATSCIACLPGQFSDAGAMQTSSQVCKGCPAGTFENEEGSTLCKYCPSGRFTNPNAGVSETSIDNACEVCSPGQFSANPDSSKCKFCAPGFAFTGTDTACEGCPPGTYQTKTVLHTPLVRCAKGHVL